METAMSHVTDNLRAYPLPSELLAKLVKIDTIAQRCARRGGSVPDCIVLDAADFSIVDSIVSRASAGVHDAGSVHFNGRRLLPLYRQRYAA
jgi:hypothetical protein